MIWRLKCLRNRIARRFRIKCFVWRVRLLSALDVVRRWRERRRKEGLSIRIIRVIRKE